MADGEKVGETLSIKDDNVITIPPAGGNGAVPLTVNVAQKKPANKRKFAEGMGTGEKVGETLNIKDNDVITVPPNGRNGAEPLVVNVAQQKALANKNFHNQRKFAEGMGSGEKVGETLEIKDNNVITIPPAGENGAVPLTVNVAQKHHSHAQRFQAVPIGRMMSEMVAGRHPHHIQDSLLMTDDEYTLLQAEPGAGFPNDLAVVPGPLLGKPGLPSQSTLSAAPEKEWQQWAQDFVDWEDGQTDAANTRLPYASTFAQLTAPDDNPSNLEDFIMEDNGIPLNIRL